MAKAADVKASKLSSDSYDANEEGWLDKLIADEDEPDRATLCDRSSDTIPGP